jgi:hypothetical protein
MLPRNYLFFGSVIACLVVVCCQESPSPHVPNLAELPSLIHNVMVNPSRWREKASTELAFGWIRVWGMIKSGSALCSMYIICVKDGQYRRETREITTKRTQIECQYKKIKSSSCVNNRGNSETNE